jgi:hypothetical protein
MDLKDRQTALSVCLSADANKRASIKLGKSKKA